MASPRSFAAKSDSISVVSPRACEAKMIEPGFARERAGRVARSCHRRAQSGLVAAGRSEKCLAQPVQSRLWRELGIPTFCRYLVTVRRATVKPWALSSFTSSSSL